MASIYPVILCGGAGTRLWPASRPARPKQFIALLEGRSLFQATLERMYRLGPPVVVAGRAYREEIEKQSAELGIRPTILVEPVARDSAAAIAAAAIWIADQDPEALAAVVASDHHIPDSEAFRDAILAAAPAAAEGYVVTFGIRPTAPQTAYGYIQPGSALPVGSGVLRLERFVEKPDADTAARYVADGFLWNSGNFLFRARTVAEALARCAPELSAAVEEAVGGASTQDGCVSLGAAFGKAPKISFDYAFMESAENAAVAPVDYAWSDLGAWDAVWEASPRDVGGNAVRGPARLLDSSDCLVRANGGPVVLGVGLRNIAVISEPDGILVCDLNAAQGVKSAVDALNSIGAGPIPKTGPQMDFGRWLRATALPVWWSLGADHARGGFHELLDLTGAPAPAPRRARVQARQIYAYAAAGAMGWTGPWADAVRHGLRYFLGRYRREDGLFRTLVNADGTAADETATLYDQAFALLALASAAERLPNEAERLTQVAQSILRALRKQRLHLNGGFAEMGGASPFLANPHMHLLEASLAWERVTGDAQWRVLSDHIVELCLNWFIDKSSGALREVFQADWAPLRGRAGRMIEPGHQFEWAWLLESWARARRTHEARQAARRLFAVGEMGVDPNSGVAASVMPDDLTLKDASARLWPQTERIKAAAILGETETDASLWSAYRTAEAEARQALQAFLDTPTPGLWRDKRSVDGRFVIEPAPASSFYHIVCAIQEMERVAEVERRRDTPPMREAAEDWTFVDGGEPTEAPSIDDGGVRRRPTGIGA